MISNDGLLKSNSSGNDDFIIGYNQICKQYELDKDKWIQELREQGFKASHPNDGWVDRDRNIVTFAYPHFDDGARVGDKVMLGWYSKEESNKAIILTNEYNNMFSSEYKIFYFEYKGKDK